MKRSLAFLLALLLVPSCLAVGSPSQRVLFAPDPLSRGLLWNAPLRANLSPTKAVGGGAATFSRGSAGDYLAPSGLIASAATDAPRFDYGLSGDMRPGLLLEPAATNLSLQSETLGNSTWTTSGAAISVTSDAATAPDGNATAEKLVEDSTNATHFLRQDVATSASTNYLFSLYCKAGERSWVALRFVNKGGSASSAFFNLATGAVGTASGVVSSGILPVGNGWYRCWIVVGSATGATQTNVRVAPCSADNTLTYQGDGSSGVYCWGAQFEVGVNPTAYIPTVASTVTRSADAITYPAAGNISYLAGSVSFWVWMPVAGNATTSASRMLFDTDGTAATTNRIYSYLTTGGLLNFTLYGSTAGGFNRIQVSPGSNLPANQWNHVCLTWDVAGNLKAYANGVTAGSQTSSSFTALTGIGTIFSPGYENVAASFQPGIRFRDLRIYNRVLTQPEAVRLSQMGVN